METISLSGKRFNCFRLEIGTLLHAVRSNTKPSVLIFIDFIIFIGEISCQKYGKVRGDWQATFKGKGSKVKGQRSKESGIFGSIQLTFNL